MSINKNLSSKNNHEHKFLPCYELLCYYSINKLEITQLCNWPFCDAYKVAILNFW